MKPYGCEQGRYHPRLSPTTASVLSADEIKTNTFTLIGKIYQNPLTPISRTRAPCSIVIPRETSQLSSAVVCLHPSCLSSSPTLVRWKCWGICHTPLRCASSLTPVVSHFRGLPRPRTLLSSDNCCPSPYFSNSCLTRGRGLGIVPL